MKKYFLIFLLAASVSCRQNTSTSTSANRSDSSLSERKSLHPKVSDAQIDRILDTLLTLSIVKDASRMIDSASMGSRHISFMPDSIVGTNNQVYIAVGDNRPDRFETFMNFFVDTSTYRVRVYDVMKDDTVDLKEYESRLTDLNKDN